MASFGPGTSKFIIFCERQGKLAAETMVYYEETESDAQVTADSLARQGWKCHVGRLLWEYRGEEKLTYFVRVKALT